MGKTSKTIALILIGVITISCLSLLAVKSVNAQSLTKPSVPQFTIQIVNHTLDTPSTESIDPYTGQSVTTPSTHKAWQTLDLAIKNQPFTQHTENETLIQFLYNIRYKGPFTDNWTILFGGDSYPVANSSSDYTVISFDLQGQNPPILQQRTLNFPPKAQVQFQVQALIGSVNRQPVMLGGWVFSGETSDWSNTQTITIGETASNSLSPAPTVPELYWLMIMPLLLAIFAVVVIVRHRKTAG